MFWNATNAWRDTNKHANKLPKYQKDTLARWSFNDSLVVQWFPRTSSGHQRTGTKQPSPLNTKMGVLTRPNTAPALFALKSQKTHAPHKMSLLARPNTAPAHEDPYLQYWENKEVDRCIGYQRREKLATNERLTEGLQVYELNLYHGAMQRSRSSRSAISRHSANRNPSRKNSLLALQKTLSGDAALQGTSRDSFQHFVAHAYGSDQGRSSHGARAETLSKSKQEQPGSYYTADDYSAADNYFPSLHKIAVSLKERYGTFGRAFGKFSTNDELHFSDWVFVVKELAPESDARDLWKLLRLSNEDNVSADEFEEAFDMHQCESANGN
jgi:hypothetical protein